MRIYLAGPISGKTWGGANDWRKHIEERLWEYGISCYSPMRGTDELRDVGVIEGSYPLYPMTNARAAVTRDRQDVVKADLMIVNFHGARRASIGTCVEFGWADAARVPIITIMEEFQEGQIRNPHEHDFIRELSGWVVPNVNYAVNIAKSILLP